MGWKKTTFLSRFSLVARKLPTFVDKPLPLEPTSVQPVQTASTLLIPIVKSVRPPSSLRRLRPVNGPARLPHHWDEQDATTDLPTWSFQTKIITFATFTTPLAGKLWKLRASRQLPTSYEIYRAPAFSAIANLSRHDLNRTRDRNSTTTKHQT